MKYKVKKTCYGFKGGYYTEGDIVEFSDNETPPKHFQAIGIKKPVVTPEAPKAPEVTPEPAPTPEAEPELEPEVTPEAEQESTPEPAEEEAPKEEIPAEIEAPKKSHAKKAKK